MLDLSPDDVKSKAVTTPSEDGGDGLNGTSDEEWSNGKLVRVGDTVYASYEEHDPCLRCVHKNNTDVRCYLIECTSYGTTPEVRTYDHLQRSGATRIVHGSCAQELPYRS